MNILPGEGTRGGRGVNPRNIDWRCTELLPCFQIRSCLIINSLFESNVKKVMCTAVCAFVIWLCLTRTGNYQIHEFDIDRGVDFPSRSVMFCSEKTTN